MLWDVEAADVAILIVTTWEEEWDCWVEPEELFDRRLEVREVGDVGLFNETVAAHYLVQLGSEFGVDGWVFEDFSHAPLDRA